MHAGLPVLEELEIATPCSASWDEMTGDDRVRHCGSCDLDVFNLSGMTRNEARELVAGVTGRMCVRMLKRHDGTVITQDCPTALARARRRVWAIASVAAAIAGSAIAAICGVTLMVRRPDNAEHADVFKKSLTLEALVSAFTAQPIPIVQPHYAIAGGITAPPPQQVVSTPIPVPPPPPGTAKASMP